MTGKDLEEKSKTPKVKEPKKVGIFKKIGIGAIATLALIFIGHEIYDKYKLKIDYYAGEVQVSRGNSRDNRFFYTVKEDGTERFEEWHKKKYFRFEDKNGDGEINEIRILLADYRKGEDIFLTDEKKEWVNEEGYDRWKEIGKTEIEARRRKYRKHIPFKKILDKIED